MTRPLLEMKIRIPPMTQRLVNRSRLTGLLEREIARLKLVTVIAPAGYGKTTLMSQWAHESDYPIAWLSLSEDDDDEEFLFRSLVAAWELIQPDIKESHLGLLTGASTPDRDAVLNAFVTIGLHQTGQTVFVLDDYQAIRDPSVHDALAHLLDHLPPSLHFVLVSRRDPRLPLARYRARRELLELRFTDLQFLPEETDELLNGSLELELDKDEIKRLRNQTEGWIAGLQLAALDLQRHGAGFARSQLTGRQRHISDYLAQEVIHDLSPDARQFLLQTSILEQLNAELCDAVTGRYDGQDSLERLERDGLFLAPLDDRREWYRYHPIFASFARQLLRRSVPAEDAVALHRRAGGWYLEHDLPEAAFRHILAGHDADLMIELFEQYAYAKISSGEVRIVQRWFDALPTEWLEQRLDFGFYRMMLLLAAGTFDAFVRQLNELEQLLACRQETVPAQRGRVIALRCILACFQNDLPAAQKYADEALQLLPSDDFNFRPGIFGALGDTFRRNGHWNEAHAWYLKVLDFANARPVRPQSVHLFGALADLNLRQGRLQDAAQNWRQALGLIDRPENRGRFPLPLLGWVDIRMAEILYEWNDLKESRRFLRRGQDRAELGGDVRSLIAVHLIKARMELAEGATGAAADSLAQARPLVESSAFAEWTGQFGRLQVELWLARNQHESAKRWAKDAQRSPEHRDGPESASEQLTVARVLGAGTTKTERDNAMSLLERVLAMTAEDGRMGIQIEAFAIQALVHRQRGESVRSLRSLEQALRLAEPEGFVRLFADLGLPMARLLREARSRAIMPEYVDRLLHAQSTQVEVGGVTPIPLPEPLTAREREVVRLLALGLTNAEIASQLYVSAETVKKHAGNIYAKLSVRNRTQAVSRARELDLLS